MREITILFSSVLLTGGPSNASPSQRYGALSMTSLLAPCMVRHPVVKPALVTFLMTHVLHEFNAPEGYMRYIVGIGPSAVRFSLTRATHFVPMFPGLSSLG